MGKLLWREAFVGAPGLHFPPQWRKPPPSKGKPLRRSHGAGGSSGLVAWLANSEVLAAMETCTSPSLWLKSQTKPQNKRRQASLFVQLQKPWWEGKEGLSGSRHPRSGTSCSSYLSSSLSLCLALIQPNDGRKRWFWDGNVQIFWVRTMS